MKKNINIILSLLLILILSSCVTSQDEVNKAKKNLGINEGNKVITDTKETFKNDTNKGNIEEELNINTGSIEKQIETNSGSTNSDENIKKIEIKSLTKDQLLELDDLSNKNLLGGEVEITGKTLGNVDKIVVSFVNKDSDFPVDEYTLKQFKPGNKTFLYRAFSRYETLDYGKNVYIFKAYSGDEVTELELILNVIDNKDKKDINVEDISLSELPSSKNFGNPVDLGNGKVTYSDLNGLEIKRAIISELTCEKVTSVLADEINGYFYWNTCRPIKDNEGVSFYVIRLKGDKYIYEKHYYLPYQGLYGIQELETGTGVTSENIGAKNSELKERNEDFGIVKISDELFKEILK